jgi:hypothetical protein
MISVILMIPAVRDLTKYHYFLGNGHTYPIQNFTNANYQRIRQRYRLHASYYMYSRAFGTQHIAFKTVRKSLLTKVVCVKLWSVGEKTPVFCKGWPGEGGNSLNLHGSGFGSWAG